MKDRLIEKIRSKGYVLGTVMQRNAIYCLELAAHAGFDFLMLDWQHGSWNKDSMIAGLRGC
jgi:2-keto-3-deoxy-L-rhamnonate aldolase RhmA